MEQLIKAVAYTRKSTRGEQVDRNGKKKERQEKSLSQQKSEILKLASGRFEIVAWFEDEGVSGWKRDDERPDFKAMLEQVKSLGARAIACDSLDRFSRASVNETQADANALHLAGVRWIATASHGDYDLGSENDIGEIIRFV